MVLGGGEVMERWRKDARVFVRGGKGSNVVRKLVVTEKGGSWWELTSVVVNGGCWELGKVVGNNQV